MQQSLVLALAHCVSISSNANLQQQVIDEVLKDLIPACQHLQALYQSPGMFFNPQSVCAISAAAIFSSCKLCATQMLYEVRGKTQS